MVYVLGFFCFSLTVGMVILIKRLLRFDVMWDELDEVITKYLIYLDERTSRGILTDHPEVREFHEETLSVKRRMFEIATNVKSIRGFSEK